MAQLRETVQEIFRDIFNEPRLELRDDMDAGSIADWDSLRHIEMIAAVEKAFKIRISTGEIARLKEPGENVGTLLALVERKTGSSR